MVASYMPVNTVKQLKIMTDMGENDLFEADIMEMLGFIDGSDVSHELQDRQGIHLSFVMMIDFFDRIKRVYEPCMLNLSPFEALQISSLDRMENFLRNFLSISCPCKKGVSSLIGGFPVIYLFIHCVSKCHLIFKIKSINFKSKPTKAANERTKKAL